MAQIPAMNGAVAWTSGDTFTIGTTVYTYDGTKWTGVVVGDLPGISPANLSSINTGMSGQVPSYTNATNFTWIDPSDSSIGVTDLNGVTANPASTMNVQANANGMFSLAAADGGGGAPTITRLAAVSADTNLDSNGEMFTIPAGGRAHLITPSGISRFRAWSSMTSNVRLISAAQGTLDLNNPDGNLGRIITNDTVPGTGGQHFIENDNTSSVNIGLGRLDGNTFDGIVIVFPG